MRRLAPLALLLPVILLTAILLRPDAAAAPDEKTPLRIARFNISRLLDSSPQLKRLQSEIALVYGARTRKLEAEVAGIQRDLAALPNAPGTRADKIRQQQALLVKLQKSQKELSALNEASNARKLAALKKFHRAVTGARDRLCAERGIDLLLAETTLVVEKAPSGTALAAAMSSRAVWCASDRVEDLTDAMLAEISKK